MSHTGTHGDVVLPADYVGEHVRLGYAATEHGWQSDTVDDAIALTSPATTRRGLYVAATRGRNQNILCVITDSNDLAEARDVLETVLAIDRADVPATTQRQALAHTTATPLHPPAVAPAPRCEIPPWFPTVLADAQRHLRDAQLRGGQRSARREHAEAEAADADTVVVEVAAATATDRDARHHAEARADDARRRHTAAAHQLATAPRRQRRALRHDLHIAQQQLERAENYLERTRQRTAPAVERHNQAMTAQRTARDEVLNCATLDRLDTMLPTIGEHQLHVHALNTWQHWARGHDVPDKTMRTVYTVLAHRLAPEQQLAVTLRHDLGGADRDMRTATRSETAAMRAGLPDLGIEL